MTVKELRQLLFDIGNQNAEVVVVCPEDIEDGHIKRTRTVVTRRDDKGHRLPFLGHREDPKSFVSILTGLQ